MASVILVPAEHFILIVTLVSFLGITTQKCKAIKTTPEAIHLKL